MATDPARGSAHIGAPIDQDSESKFLASAIGWLDARKLPFVVLANLHIGGRQIDCVIAAANAVLVVEVKSSYLPVRGEINGTWSRLHSSGQWLPYGNAYEQALKAKNALRDAMASVKDVGPFYPDGHVVFTRSLPDGSQLTRGDFKVSVQTLNEFMAGLVLQGASPWTLDDWRRLASNLSLTSVTVNEIIAPRELRLARDVVRHYCASAATEYEGAARRWLSENTEQQTGLLSAATSGPGCFISGPSGCGKTLVARWLAFECTSQGNPALCFAAKDFAGSWSTAIRREIGLLFDGDPRVLMRAIERTDRPVLLILDATNELGGHRESALRGARALARRLGARLIVTGQERSPPELAGLNEFSIDRPSFDLKRRIAERAARALSATALDVLKAVASGIEADMVGQIGGSLDSNASRLTLINEYLRQRLGSHARSASFGLRRLARVLHEEIAFSIPEHRFDDLMRLHNVPFADCDAMFTSAVLTRRAGRVSFAHEMIQSACAAFDLARQAEANPIAFGDRMSTALLEGIAADAVAAIENGSTCRAVLERATNGSLVYAARIGALGPIAKATAQQLLEESATACAAEIRNARLVLLQGDNGHPQLTWAEDSRRTWTDPERARLYAIGRCGAKGVGLDTCLRLCAEMDKRLETERLRLRNIARELKFPLRSQSFALAYYGHGPSLGFASIARPGYSSSEPRTPQCNTPSITLRDLTSGQLYFVLENRHEILERYGDDRFIDELTHVMQERFEREPYHVQLTMLIAAAFGRRASDEKLARLVEALKSINVSPSSWAISSQIAETLQILGALDAPEGMTESVRAEIESLLIDDEGAVDKDLAASVCMRIFDDVYGDAYYNEIMALDPERRHRLFRRALGSPKVKRSFNFVWLCNQVAAFDDVADIPTFAAFAELPDPSNPFPQEEWGGFVLAIRFLGGYGAALPSLTSEAVPDRCLSEIRMLIHAAEGGFPDSVSEAKLAWGRLRAMSPQLVIGCLSEVNEALIRSASHKEDGGYFKFVRLSELYPYDCLEVARRFIREGADAQYFHHVPDRDLGPTFAFGVVANHGDRSDIDSLRALTRAHRFARHAVGALKLLDVVK